MVTELYVCQRPDLIPGPPVDVFVADCQQLDSGPTGIAQIVIEVLLSIFLDHFPSRFHRFRPLPDLRIELSLLRNETSLFRDKLRLYTRSVDLLIVEYPQVLSHDAPELVDVVKPGLGEQRRALLDLGIVRLAAAESYEAAYHLHGARG